MKRTFAVLCLIGLVAAGVSAAPATSPYKSGSIVAQGGIGIGFPGQSGSMVVPPLIASVEYQLQVSPQLPLSFGGVAGYASSKYTYSDTYGDTWTWNYSDIIVGARVAYHFINLIKVPKLDTYAGMMVGYDIVSVKSSASGPYVSLGASPSYTVGASGLLFGAYAGARYYFTPSIGVYGEVGYNLGFVNVGASFAF